MRNIVVAMGRVIADVILPLAAPLIFHLGTVWARLEATLKRRKAARSKVEPVGRLSR
ncbi:MAG: hypothetical protein KDB14_28315 [Planctomycetales bacterium]|nr:hypothetical protein [Planctomycetales bacterium]